MIEAYYFGSITIDGKTYNHDVEVRWSPRQKFGEGQADEVLKWWRKESHLVNVEDAKRAVEQNPETIIIGTGESGVVQLGEEDKSSSSPFAVARVTEEAKKYIQERGIKLIIDLTEQAIKTFNIINEESLEEEGKQRKVIGFFHLTC